MVKKLFKHEVLAYLRTIVPMHMLLIGIAILSRLIQLFDNNSTAYNIVFWSSVVVYCVSIVVCFILTFVFGIRRFYSNMFSHEGYLTLTLPVTSTNHILVKNIVATMFQLIGLVMTFISVCVLTFGEVTVEIFKSIGYLVEQEFILYSYNEAIFIAMSVIFVILYISAAYMLFYTCIALGQKAKKNRVAAAVGIFFLYYIIMQVIGTIFVIIVTVFYDQLRIDELVSYLYLHIITLRYLVLSAGIVIYALLWIIGFAITKRVIDKKLNLE